MLTVEKEDGTKIRWWYHVSPTLPVRGEDGSVCDLVFDPSLFDGPVTLEEWGQIMRASPEKLEIASYGASPKGHAGEYCPNTPIDDSTDRDAESTMKNYLTCQQKGQRTVFNSHIRQQLVQTQKIRFPIEGKTWRSVQRPFQQASQETTMVQQPSLPT